MNKKFEDLENVPENSDDQGMVPFVFFCLKTLSKPRHN